MSRVAIFDRNPSTLEAATTELQEQGATVLAVEVDGVNGGMYI